MTSTFTPAAAHLSGAALQPRRAARRNPLAVVAKAAKEAAMETAPASPTPPKARPPLHPCLQGG